jgi:L-ribulokinase
MTSLEPRAYVPDPGRKAVYDELYGIYRELHDTFGGVAGTKADLGTLMKRLLSLRDRVVTSGAAMAGA